jgi:hypothetical protein
MGLRYKYNYSVKIYGEESWVVNKKILGKLLVTEMCEKNTSG